MDQIYSLLSLLWAPKKNLWLELFHRRHLDMSGKQKMLSGFPYHIKGKGNKIRTHSLNKTVIYFWLKTKIVWTAHYKGIKIFSPRLSDHFHTIHLACTRQLLQIQEKQKNTLNKRRNKPISKEKKRKSRSPSCKNMTDCTITKYFGLVPSHRERNRIVWRQQTAAQEAQKMWHRQLTGYQLYGVTCLIVSIVIFLFVLFCR